MNKQMMINEPNAALVVACDLIWSTDGILAQEEWDAIVRRLEQWMYEQGRVSVVGGKDDYAQFAEEFAKLKGRNVEVILDPSDYNDQTRERLFDVLVSYLREIDTEQSMYILATAFEVLRASVETTEKQEARVMAIKMYRRILESSGVDLEQFNNYTIELQQRDMLSNIRITW
jgi:hypothetical protein